MLLGVNIDHIAVLREARKINDPNPLDALGILKRTNVDLLTIHLREDRRHINDIDAKNIILNSPIPVNLECSLNVQIIKKVCELKPYKATIVPEKRQEVTTEGGLDLKKYKASLEKNIKFLQDNDIEVSLFIDPNPESIKLASKLKANQIEIHTGTYANIYAMLYGDLRQSAHSIKELEKPKKTLLKMLETSLKDISIGAKLANELGLGVAAGHGLNYQNIFNILKIEEIEELNIGQSIIARSIFTGLENAIKDMKICIEKSQK